MCWTLHLHYRLLEDRNCCLLLALCPGREGSSPQGGSSFRDLWSLHLRILVAGHPGFQGFVQAGFGPKDEKEKVSLAEMLRDDL